MQLTFTGDIWYWRGPSPYYFVTVPDEQAGHLHEVSAAVSYGWGMIPATVRVGNTDFSTSLFPKNGGYIVPMKDVVRRSEGLDEGDTVTVRLLIDAGASPPPTAGKL